MTVILPFSALVGDNHRLIPARVGRFVRLIANPEYRDAKANLRHDLHAMRLRCLRGPVAVHCAFWFPDRRKRDQTNYAKFLHDALAGIAYEDDSQIVDARQTKAIDRANPRVEITITAVTGRREAAA